MAKKLKNAYNPQLNAWYNQIKDYERLNIDEARDLCQKMLGSEGEIRERYRNKLILGTLYLVYNFVCDSGLTAIKASYFDTDDIISISTEVWIELMDSGILLGENIKYFSFLFSATFYRKIIHQLVGEQEDYYRNNRPFNFEVFGNLVALYFKYFNDGVIVDDKSCYECVVSCLKQVGVFDELTSGCVYQIYQMFRDMDKMIDIKDISRVSVTDLSFFKGLILDTLMFDKQAGVIAIGDFTEKVDSGILAEELRDVIFKTDILTASQKIYIDQMCGFTMKATGNADCAKQLGVTSESVRQCRARTLRRLCKLDERGLLKSLYYRN